MFGLIAFGVLIAYIAIWWFVIANLDRHWAKAIAIVIALAIPFWDVPIGYLNYSAHCASDGGLAKVAEIPPFKSIYLAHSIGRSPEKLIEAGLEMVEEPKYGTSVVRSRRTPGGAIEKTEVAKAESDLRIRYIYHDPLPWHLLRQELVLERNSSGQVVLRATSYTWLGGWLRTYLPLGPLSECHVGSAGTLIQETVGAIKR